MNKLKRSKTSVGDLEHLDADLRHDRQEHVAAPSLPPDAPQRARPKRGFSMSKLTATVKNKKTPHKPIEKASISRPILYPRNPVVPPASCTELGEVSPPPSVFVVCSASSSPGGSLRGTAQHRPYHTHSVSDPVKFWPPVPTGPPLHLPVANCEKPHQSGRDTPLTGISESPFELEQAISTLGVLDILDKLKTMEPARLQPPVAGTKARALQQAKEMEELVAERAKRSGEEPPPYDFYELIGKGSYGRVFKGLNRNTGGLVAIKIIDIDRVDYEEMTSKNLSETLKEIDILQQLRDSKARPYVNIIEEARSVHNELWIVSEYASGGSVATLMKPSMINEPFGLEEKFIIPIARELALGLKYTHEAGVIHRDLKCM
jgi:protein-serine/threonine kinase